MKYKIYKLIHKDLGVIYVGQTIRTLEKRKATGYRQNVELQKIYKECSIELIEETNDVSRERYWIDNLSKSYNLLNKRLGATGLERKEQFQLHQQNNKGKIKQYLKDYYDANEEKIKLYQKAYREKRKQRG